TWVVRHIQGSEAAVHINRDGAISTGFVDNLVDLTAIEYESDLRKSAKFNQGLNQVKDYCSSLLNHGHDPDLVLGILSDTVRWFAYRIDKSQLSDGPYNRNNVSLIEVDHVDASDASEKVAGDFARFITRYLARQGARPFTAEAIANDLGFGTVFTRQHTTALFETIQNAFNENPGYADLIAELWKSFVSYLAEDGHAERFDMTTFVDEFYISILGKLICANFLEQKALSSTDAELSEIINGRFFENKGLNNFVEYDYFGWLNNGANLASVLSVAKAIQQDLVAYDFSVVPAEDLFGNLMAQLANRAQRLLLGQEWTPAWLSKQIVERVTSEIPYEKPLRLIDMCCGSGSMIVQSVRIAKQRLEHLGIAQGSTEANSYLTQSITGFDIDPLAVLLSKINWVLAAKDSISFGSHPISIPVYHADSLFAITPLSKDLRTTHEAFYLLKVAEFEIKLPVFLISPLHQSLFDRLIEQSYHMVLDAAEGAPLTFGLEEATPQINVVVESLHLSLNESELTQTVNFYIELTTAIDRLNRDGRNGIWASILKNSFRPGLVYGQFNGLVSNPPWLALSKIAQNPYQLVLKQLAANFGIKPAGSSHLHIELATIFLLHSIREFLHDDAIIGCILPETVLNGHHHNPFRSQGYLTAGKPVNYVTTELWKVAEGTFKNNAIVLLGKKGGPLGESVLTFPGKRVFPDRNSDDTTFHINIQGNRSAWGETAISGTNGFYEPAAFRQGADIMPRNLLFYETRPAGNSQTTMISIDPVRSRLAFTVKDAKKHQQFRLTERTLPETLFFDVITSNLLVPFDLSTAQKALLPLKKDYERKWVGLNQSEITAMGNVARNTFNEIAATANPTRPTVEALFDLINVRGKLSQQIIQNGTYLVMTGAGGGIVCSAFVAADEFDLDRLIIDQTIYFASVG
ncbi:MAG TPA: N-6 DNA methylase, partial [Mucilaginibacter sp.]